MSLVCLALMWLTPSWAEPLKRGRVLCQGKSCAVLGTTEADQPVDMTSPASAQSSSAGLNEGHKVQRTQKRPKKSRSIPAAPDTNLPAYYAESDRSTAQASERNVFVPKSHDPKLTGLSAGDVVWAVIEQEITASPELPTPIRAVATTGPYKGAYFLGDATLERELKRVCLSFSKFRARGASTTYGLKATGLAPKGSVCLGGEYVSQTGKFLVAELASAAGAALLDSTINRSQTALGTFVQEPTLSNSGKAAAAAALSKTADRFAESVRSAPEYTHLKGYQEIQIMIQDDPVESGT